MYAPRSLLWASGRLGWWRGVLRRTGADLHCRQQAGSHLPAGRGGRWKQLGGAASRRLLHLSRAADPVSMDSRLKAAPAAHKDGLLGCHMT